MKQRIRVISAALLLVSLVSGYSGSGITLKNDVRNFIVNLANYIVSIHPSTGTLGGTGGSYRFVYVQGCYVITLVSAYEITGDTSYVNEAKRWCRWYIGQQVVYDSGDKGYWVDAADNGQRYLADTQKGAYALLRTYVHADSALKADILTALRRFSNRIKAGGFIVSTSFYGGALNVYGDGSGDGYTTSTGLGAAMWSAYYRLTGDTAALFIASHNAEWVIRSMEADGRLPMYIWGAKQDVGVETEYNAIGYSSFGLSTCWRYTPYANTRALFDTGNVPLNIQWLLDRQDTSGIWSPPEGSESNVRTPMIGMYLNWYATSHDTSRLDVRRALRMWYGHLLDSGMYDNNRYRCLAGIFMTDLYEKGLPSLSRPTDTGLLFQLSAGLTPPAGVTGDDAHVSAPFFMGDTIKGYGGLYFKGDQGITDTIRSWDIRIRLRTATTENGLSFAVWMGPCGTSDWYTATGEQINPVHNNQPWIQYQTVLFRQDTAFPVSLDEVTIMGRRDTVETLLRKFIPGDTATNDSIGPWTDDFAAGGRLAWLPASSSRWSLDPDQGDTALHLNITDYSNTGDRPGEYTLLKNVRVRDFDLTVSARSPEPPGNAYPDYVVMFGYQDANNFYMLVANKAPQYSEIYHVVNGVRAVLYTINMNLVPDTSYDTVRLLYQHDTLSAFMNGTRIAAIALALPGPGLVGLGSYNDEVYFDDFCLTSLDPPTSATTAQPASVKSSLVLEIQPNPFNPTATIRLEGAGIRGFQLNVFRAADGRRITSQYVEGAETVWKSSETASGIYLFEATLGGRRVVRRAVLMK